MAASAFGGSGAMKAFALGAFVTSPTFYLRKKKIMAVIQPLTGLLPTSVVWDKDPQPMVSDVDNAIITMNLKASSILGGSDDKRRTFYQSTDPNLSRYDLELTGNRTLVLTLRCEVFNYQQEASEILDRVRTLLNGNFELGSAEMCFQDNKLITDLPTSYDNRVVNVAILEIQLGFVSSFLGYEQIGQGWIDTVNTDNIIPGDFLP